MKRDIITINEALCNGCGNCVPGCPEGALQIIDGKARLVSDLFCDGLGACMGDCPTGALTVETREAQDYSERRVMDNIINAGPNTIRAHLTHLLDHNETELHQQAVAVLRERGIPLPEATTTAEYAPGQSGCPGARMEALRPTSANDDAPTGELQQWPVQLHLLSPRAPYFHGADVVLAADCTAFSVGDFHPRYLRGRTLAIACPKLDDGTDSYVDKLTAMIDDAKINTLTVIIMNVPCCRGLVRLAESALTRANRNIPLKKIVVNARGQELSEEWL